MNLPGSSIIKSKHVHNSFQSRPRRTEQRCAGHVSMLNKRLVFMCTLCEKQTGEWSPICEMATIHGWESEEERCVCGNHSDVPIGSKKAPCQGWPLCGLFTLRAIPDGTCTRQRARHTAHLEKMYICVPHTENTDLKNSSCGRYECTFCVSVCLTRSLACKQTHTRTHTPVLYPPPTHTQTHPLFQTQFAQLAWQHYVNAVRLSQRVLQIRNVCVCV